MFNVEQNLLLLSVVSDERVQSVTVRNPTNQARVSGQGNDRVSLDTVDTGDKGRTSLIEVTTHRIIFRFTDVKWDVFRFVAQPEVLPQRCRIVRQQCVDQTKELHHPLILPQVLVSL